MTASLCLKSSAAWLTRNCSSAKAATGAGGTGPSIFPRTGIEFDELYRQHLANVYHALGLAPPEELSRPILKYDVPNLNQPPTHPIHPVIDGEVTSYFEWMGAGRYRPDNRSGSMHSDEPRIRDIYYGADSDSLYLRLDLTKVSSSTRSKCGRRPRPFRCWTIPQFSLRSSGSSRSEFRLTRSAHRRNGTSRLAINGELLAARIFIER